MASITIEEAQAQLAEMIGKLAPGEAVVITSNSQPVARLVALASEQPRPVPGRCKGMLTVLSDEDGHLKDWSEYLP